jgi:hypothetical protein
MIWLVMYRHCRPHTSLIPPERWLQVKWVSSPGRTWKTLVRNAVQPQNLAPAIWMSILGMRDHGLLLTLVLAVVASLPAGSW